jgi:D-alanine transfer protein
MPDSSGEPNNVQRVRTRRPMGVFAALLATVIVITAARATQIYAQTLASQYLRSVAPDDLLFKQLTLTFQRAALADSKILPVYGSSELYWAGDPHRAPQFFQSSPTGFSVFAVGHAGTGDLFFMQTFAALGSELHGKLLAVEDSSDWFYNPDAIPAGQYAGNFSPEIANMFVFDAPVSLDVREAGARRMLDYPDTLKDDDLLRSAIESLADATFPHLLEYELLVPAGRLSSWILQVQDAAQTIAFIGSRHTESAPPVQPRSVNWIKELQTASQLAASQSTNNPFGIEDGGFAVLKGNVPLSQIYSAMVLSCFGKSNRDGAVYEFPAEWDATMRSSKAWTDLKLEAQVLRELGARPFIYSLPLAGVYDNYTPVSRSVRQSLYDRYRVVTSANGIAALDLSGYDEDPYFLRDPIDHLSPRGWILVNRALDIYWHQHVVEPAANAITDLARAAPTPGLPPLARTCSVNNTSFSSAPVTATSPDAAKLLRPPWGDGQSPAFMVATDLVLTNASTRSTVAEPGGSVAVAMRATPVVDLTQHFMLDARLIDLSGAIKSEVTLEDSPLATPPTGKWGVPVDYVLNLPISPNLPRGVYHIDVAAFRIPTWQALPLTGTNGSIANSIGIGSVLIAPVDYMPLNSFADYDLANTSLSANLGGELSLVGATSVQVNRDRVSFDLFWRASHRLSDNYTIFVQLLDRNGRLVTQLDGYPWNGRYPTSAWPPGRIVRDTYKLPVPADTPAETYQVIVGAYQQSTMQRLPVLDLTGRSLGDYVSLATVDLP